MKGKYVILLVVVIIIIVTSSIILINKYNQVSYEWVLEKESTIGQYRLYINDLNGKHIDGKINITYINDKSEVIEVSKDGVLYVKNIIASVSNPKRN